MMKNEIHQIDDFRGKFISYSLKPRKEKIRHCKDDLQYLQYWVGYIFCTTETSINNKHKLIKEKKINNNRKNIMETEMRKIL